MTDAGRIARRTLLTGAAGAAVVVAGGAVLGKHELDVHPGLRSRLFGDCGSTPSLPSSRAFRLRTGSLDSKAMGRPMPYSLTFPNTQPSFGTSNDDRYPLIVALPGEGGSELSVPNQLGLPNYASAAGLNAMIVSPGDVGSTYYHPRTDGTDMLSFILDELVPRVEDDYSVGGSRARRAVYGYSMGGYGALLIAQQRPGFACAVAAASPAVFPSYHAAVTGHPDTFDSEADWEQYGVWDQRASMGAVAVHIDCGSSDPFAGAARSLLQDIPGALGAISSGCHDVGFWRRHAAGELADLKYLLGA
jgi:hypothetical protein